MDVEKLKKEFKEISKILKNIDLMAQDQTYSLKSMDARDYEHMHILLALISWKLINDNNDHPFIIPESASWEEICKSGFGIAERLKKASIDLEQYNDYLKNLFTTINFSEIGDDLIFKAVQHLSILNLNRNNMSDTDSYNGTIAQAAEGLIDELVKKKGATVGENYTPLEVSHLLACLLEPREGLIYDGAVGLGNNLIAVAQINKENNDRREFYGQEINPEAWKIGKLNLMLHGIYDANLEYGDTLQKPFEENYQLKKFDFILMDPPFRMSWEPKRFEGDKRGRFPYGVPGKSSGDMAFMMHAYKSLSSDGKAALVMAPGILGRGGIEKQIRKGLINEDLIETVIELPTALYYHTKVSVCVVILNKNKPVDLKDKVFMVNAANEFQSGRGKNKLDPENIDKITSIYLNIEEKEQISRVVSVKEIEDKECSLNPSRYFEKKEVDTVLGRAAVNSEAYKGSSINKVRIKDIAEVFRGMQPPRDDSSKEKTGTTCKLVNLADVEDGYINTGDMETIDMGATSSLKKYLLQPGDLIISSRGTVMKMAVVPETTESLVLSHNFIVIRPNGSFDPNYLKAFLESPVGKYFLINQQKGTTLTVLLPRDIENILVPNIPLNRQKEIVGKLKKADEDMEIKIKRAQEEHAQGYIDAYSEMGIGDAFELNKEL